LEGLTCLRELSLPPNHITDAGLVRLKGLTNLKRLNVTDTQVTEAGVGKLGRALPECNISGPLPDPDGVDAPSP
jgi:hypothetical protein